MPRTSFSLTRPREIFPGGSALLVGSDTSIIGDLYYSSVTAHDSPYPPFSAQTRYADNSDVCAGTPKWPIRSFAYLGHVDTRVSDIRIVAGSDWYNPSQVRSSLPRSDQKMISI